MSFHEAFAADLVRHGVNTIFGLVGDGNLFLMDSFHRQPGTRYVSVANEASAVAAAIGYWHVTDELGVASVTHGPALTNTITPLIEAVKARVPILLIAGDTAVADRENFQNVPQRDIVTAAGVGFEQVRTPQTAGADLATAAARALLERRPVVLNVPAEFQWSDVDWVAAPRRASTVQAVAPDPAVLDRAVGIIASARRPVVLGGRGAIAPTSRAALIRLAARIGAPLATTLKAKDLFRDEPTNLGIFGTLAHEAALAAITDSDCVIAFGAGMNEWTTAQGSLLKDKAWVHVDLDPAALGRHAVPNVGIVADAATAADAMIELLDQAEVPATSFADAELVAQLAAARTALPAPADDAVLGISEALGLIDQLTPADRVVVLDAGRFVLSAFPALSVCDPHCFVHTVNYAAIGLGVPTAIGTAVGAPTRRTTVICGDGGFALGGLTEFSTAVRHKLDVLIVVFNDGAYGAEHIQLTRRGMDPSISVFDWPDLGPVASALGGYGATVRTAGQLRRALSEAADQRPALIDIKLDPHAIPGPTGH